MGADAAVERHDGTPPGVGSHRTWHPAVRLPGLLQVFSPVCRRLFLIGLSFSSTALHSSRHLVADGGRPLDAEITRYPLHRWQPDVWPRRRRRRYGSVIPRLMLPAAYGWP